jgi:hypothetical protein
LLKIFNVFSFVCDGLIWEEPELCSKIAILSQYWKQWVIKKTVPRQLWDFGLAYESELLLTHMAHRNDH